MAVRYIICFEIKNCFILEYSLEFLKLNMEVLVLMIRFSVDLIKGYLTNILKDQNRVAKRFGL